MSFNNMGASSCILYLTFSPLINKELKNKEEQNKGKNIEIIELTIGMS